MAKSLTFATETPVTRGDVFLFAPADVAVDWSKNTRAMTPEHVADLAADIAANGQIQPALCRRLPDGRPEIVDGYHRLAACLKLAEADPAVRIKAVFQTLNDEEAFAASIRANLFRRDATPIENAVNMRRLIEQYGWDVARVAELFRLSEYRVNVLLSVLGLPSAVRRKIETGELSVNQARMLLELSGDEAVAAVEQAELDVATAPEAAVNGGKRTKVKDALKQALRDQGVARGRQSRELVKILKDRVDPVSLAITAYLKGTADEASVFAALDDAEPPVVRITERNSRRLKPAAEPKAPKGRKGRKAAAARTQAEMVAAAAMAEEDAAGDAGADADDEDGGSNPSGAMPPLSAAAILSAARAEIMRV